MHLSTLIREVSFLFIIETDYHRNLLLFKVQRISEFQMLSPKYSTDTTVTPQGSGIIVEDEVTPLCASVWEFSESIGKGKRPSLEVNGFFQSGPDR